MNLQVNPYNKYIYHIDRNNNMSLVRYILAFGVLISHFNVLCGADIPWIVTNYDRVGGFFALSGFLLIGPVLRGSSFKDFVLKRVWRIIPSYIFVVLIFAIGLSWISTYSLKDYFLSSDFWKYLAANLSFLNFLHPCLPGVFSQLNIQAVNGALWTMKVEWQLSLSAPLIVWFIKKYRCDLRKVVLIILFVSLIYRIGFKILYEISEKEIYNILGRQFLGQLLYFYGGIFVYTCYEYLLKKLKWFILSSLLVYTVFRFIDFIPFYYQVIHPFVITLLVLSFSLIPGNFMTKIDKGHNISYEIYLCHFPIMQLLAYYEIIEKIGVVNTLILGIVLTIFAAVFTYICVGRLYLSHRKVEK